MKLFPVTARSLNTNSLSEISVVGEKKEKKNVTPDANKISRQPGRKKTEKSLIGLQLLSKKRENHYSISFNSYNQVSQKHYYNPNLIKFRKSLY